MTTATRSLGDSAARGTGITLLGQGLRVALQFASTIILARLLTPEDFGLIAMVAAIIGISELVRDFGLSSAAIQAKNVTDDERTNLFWVNTGLGAASSLVVIAFSPLIVLLYGEPRLVWIIVAMSSTFVFSGINTQFKADLTRQLRFAALTGFEIAGVTAGFVLGIGSAALGLSYWAIVIQQVTTVAVACILNVSASKWKPGLPKRGVSIRRFLRFGMGVLGTQAISYVTKNIDSVSIGAVWGAGPLGLYDRAYQLLMTPLNQINAPMTRIALPILSRVHDQGEVFERYLHKAQLVGAYFTATVFAVAAGLSTPFVLVLFGPQWVGVSAIFAALAVGGVFRSIAQISYWIYLATGKTGAQLRMFLAVRPIMIVIILAGLPWGPVGVAIGQTIAYSLHWAVSLWRVGVVTGVNTRPLFLNAIRTVLVVSVPCGILAFLGTLFPVPAIVQILIGLAFALIYVAVISVFVPAVRSDVTVVLSFARRMVGSRRAPTDHRRGIRGDSQRKRSLEELLRVAAPHLRSGRWILPSASSAFHNSPEGRSAQAAAAARIRPARDLKERLVRRRTALAAPRSADITGRPSAEHGPTEALLTKDRSLVLFDRGSNSVTHVRSAPFGTDYESFRRRLTDEIPNPSWTLTDERRVLTEGLADGVEFARAAFEVRVEVTRRIVDAYAALTRRSSSPGSVDLVLGAIARVDSNSKVSSSIREEVDALTDRLIADSPTWPLVLSHGDLTGRNLIVTDRSSWMAIDFEDAGERPYFYDAYVLICQDRELLAALRAGAFAAELARLHTAAGRPADSDDDEMLLRAAALLAADYHAREHGGRFEFSLSRTWPTSG
ncbi:lipopolysaccharide biosynthesis protein [Naasia lichenicola]|uniref:Aminoglycoside phosphotransferase domain-containing protein n=1 Tax=Naasia lichenicola TaxID=2565933 RepID=A0A4S4FNG1_9MICO|nr:lipopolysaccharide biosynthesis protein [Naasia lichenicola]THG30806.1 hypothetical protein E6C64_09215 [Naasia lichenicola]